MVYDIHKDTELADAEPLLLAEIQDTVHGSLYSHFHQPIKTHNIVLCVVRFKDILFNMCIADSRTWNSQPTSR